MDDSAKQVAQATTFEWLEWFYCNADFGPADSDVRSHLKRQFMRETGKAMPGGYEDEE